MHILLDDYLRDNLGIAERMLQVHEKHESDDFYVCYHSILLRAIVVLFDVSA